ncbi:hypothetical protein MTO96_042620 [Rhipicephalus appendiculatus]
MVHAPRRAGGLGVLELPRVSAEVQVKCYARLQRLGSPIVHAVLEGALDGFRPELEGKMGVQSGIVEASSLNKALREARLTYLEDSRQKYINKSLFAFEDDPVGNRWLWPDARFMSDDRIKALRLRTNLFPTRTLSNQHSKDDSARLCRRCHKAPETTYHILQACEATHEPRCSRHNFLCKAITNKMHSLHPGAGISTDRLLVTGDGTRLRPDIVVELKKKKHSFWMWRSLGMPGQRPWRPRVLTRKTHLWSQCFANADHSVMLLSSGVRGARSHMSKHETGSKRNWP